MNRRDVLKGMGAMALTASMKGKRVTTLLTGVHVTLPSGRKYWYYNPVGGVVDTLVVGLPGTGLSPENCNDTFWVTGVPATTGWQRHAAMHGYTLALAELGPGGNWNVGGAWSAAVGATNDDLGYLNDLVSDADTRNGDTFQSCYIAGFSAGGAMAYAAHAARPELWDASAMASGWAGAGATGPSGTWTWPTIPMDCIAVHGTGDTNVPVRGGIGVDGVNFAPLYRAAFEMDRGSVFVLEPTSGGHGTAGWMADEAWRFWTDWRFRG